MKIGIHHRIAEGSFSYKWIEYCKNNNLNYKLVNAYSNTIIKDLKDCDIFLWHHHHAYYKDALFAKQLLFTLEQKGIVVFPNWKTGWHFDDKVAQKYLFEVFGIPHIPTYVFYDKNEALEWVSRASFPKVFKLRGGAGSSNVFLVENNVAANKIVKKMFSTGMNQFSYSNYIKDQYRSYKNGKLSFSRFILSSIYRRFVPNEFGKMHNPDKGYVHFQDFQKNNRFDTRVVIIGEKAYGMQRLVREGDFRASGSSNYMYNPLEKEILEIAFESAEKLGMSAVAFDFIYSEDGKPLIVEMSYGFGTKGSGKCSGYWDRKFKFHKSDITPEYWILENIINLKNAK